MKNKIESTERFLVFRDTMYSAVDNMLYTLNELLSEKDAEIERLKLEIEYFKSLLVTADFQHTRGAK